MKPVLALVWWCACLGGSPPRYDYFVLTSTSVPPAGGDTSSERPTLAVGQVSVPRYLDRESIATRVDDTRVTYSQRERWAEPLADAFERTLRQQLAADLAPNGIIVPSSVGAPTYDVQVDLLRFERRGNDRVDLWARWTLRGPEDWMQTQESRIQFALAAPTSAAAAAALSSAIARLASEIAAQVRIHAALRS